MKKIFKAVQSYFTFTKGETIAFLLLIFTIVVLQLITPLFKKDLSSYNIDLNKIKRQSDSLDSLESIQNYTYKKGKSNANQFTKTNLFKFNPNTVTVEELRQLGCPIFLANRIVNYRSKVAQFKVKADLLKVYGMDTSLYNRFYPFIELPVQMLYEQSQKSESKEKISQKLNININTADSNALKSLPGIGEKLSKRILQYRNLLGGYHTIDQLKEIYGMKEETFIQIKDQLLVDLNDIKTISINSIDFSVLSKHPYIGYNQAKLIVNYIKQHGQIISFEDLIKIKEIDIEKIVKAKPYLRF